MTPQVLPSVPEEKAQDRSNPAAIAASARGTPLAVMKRTGATPCAMSARIERSPQTCCTSGQRRTRANIPPTVTRPVRISEGWRDTPLDHREALPEAFRLPGPAILDQMNTTNLTGPGDVAPPAPGGALLVTLGSTA